MNRIDQICGIAFICAIPKYYHLKKTAGRLTTLVKRLQREGQREIAKLEFITAAEMLECHRRIAAFQRKVGWEDADLHVVSVVSFALGVIDRGKYPNIVDILEDIHDYFERAKPVSQQISDGATALETWEDLYS